METKNLVLFGMVIFGGLAIGWGTGEKTASAPPVSGNDAVSQATGTPPPVSTASGAPERILPKSPVAIDGMQGESDGGPTPDEMRAQADLRTVDPAARTGSGESAVATVTPGAVAATPPSPTISSNPTISPGAWGAPASR